MTWNIGIFSSHIDYLKKSTIFWKLKRLKNGKGQKNYKCHQILKKDEKIEKVEKL